MLFLQVFSGWSKSAGSQNSFDLLRLKAVCCDAFIKALLGLYQLAVYEVVDCDRWLPPCVEAYFLYALTCGNSDLLACSVLCLCIVIFPVEESVVLRESRGFYRRISASKPCGKSPQHHRVHRFQVHLIPPSVLRFQSKNEAQQRRFLLRHG